MHTHERFFAHWQVVWITCALIERAAIANQSEVIYKILTWYCPDFFADNHADYGDLSLDAWIVMEEGWVSILAQNV